MKYLLFLTVFFASCASIQTLDGGEVDKTPPKVIATFPDSAELNVLNSTLVFEFNEYVKTKNIPELLIISPSQIKAPTVTVKGKKVSVQLNDSLKKNTTYSLNFNGSIVDFNEGNPLDYFKYIFSTGSYIDSFSYQGNVFDIVANNNCENCNVHLYKKFNDSVVLTQKPDYVVKTDSRGNFSFENLPVDSFLVFSLLDENKNLLLDNNEAISLSNKVNTQFNKLDSIRVFPYLNNALNKPYLVPKTKPGYIQFSFKNAVTSTEVKLSANNTFLAYKFNNTRDTLSAEFHTVLDSNNIKLSIDTAKYDFTYVQKDKVYTLPLQAYFNNQNIFLSTIYSVTSIDSAKIKVKQDSTLVDIALSQINEYTISISASVDKTQKIKIELDSGFISDKHGFSNIKDTLLILPKLIDKPTLNLKIELKDSINYIIQLRNSSKLIHQYIINKPQDLIIKNLDPGQYEVVLIKDLNQNNIWDTGNPFTKTAPEYRKVSKPFEIRLNWDKELIINDL